MSVTKTCLTTRKTCESTRSVDRLTVHSVRVIAGAFLVTAVIAFGLSGERALGATKPTSVTTSVPRTTVAKSVDQVDRAEAAIPDFDLVDLRNTKTVNLASLRMPGRAMLIWLWAPN